MKNKALDTIKNFQTKRQKLKLERMKIRKIRKKNKIEFSYNDLFQLGSMRKNMKFVLIAVSE